jgi:transposase
MGQAIAVRTDYTAAEVRLLAKQAKDAAQARRLLAIAAVLDGGSRTEAATNAGMDRQTLRDWVIRFNEQGPDGLVNIPSPGAPPKLNDTHKAFLAGIVRQGPIPAIHGVVRLRACDLIMRLHEEFGLSGVGRHGLPRLEGLGLFACDRQAAGLQAGCRGDGDF